MFTVNDQVLMMVEHQNFVEGMEYVTSDDVLTFMEFTISSARAKNILADLYKEGYLIRKNGKVVRHKHGPRGYLYKLNANGVKRCDELRLMGYKIGG
jgi:hypothetical protein